MYFKQLEITGFKSFPTKTKLKFEPGVTAIVGPNGCGKSNISDAIRWVLGEQSPRSLRGASMEDVIFNGTDSIDPINMAEVSLTLSNEDKALPIDYDEVTVTRRLFRSGESEYILNKTPVRLKDITSLLMGTGMGTSSYSIIEQGKIDLILSSKPEERRYIFEEASGITRYKTKKREALRKLEHTENNLVRINDIINEVRRQINSIERHARKAERYKNDFEIMKELDVKMAVYELRNIEFEFEDNKTRLEGISQDENSLKLELDGNLALIDKYREDLENAIHNLTEMQQKLSDATIFVDKSKHKIELNTERINDLQKFKAGLEKELAGLKEKIKLQKEEIATVRARFDGISNAKESKEKALIEKEESTRNLSHEIERHQKDTRAAKNRTVDLLAVETKTKNELIKMGADLQNRRLRLRRLEGERENISLEKKNAETLFEAANKELNTKSAKVEKRRNSCDELKDRLDLHQETLGDIRRQIREDESNLISLKSKEEILKEMIETFEGFDKGVKFIMEGVKQGVLSGITGVVADMIEPENGYESALEVALGKKAQAITVENRELLKQALSYLGDNGSAHFIIHEDITRGAKYNRHKAIMARKNIPLLLSFVKIDHPNRILADFLLDDVYVVENAEKASEVLSANGGGIKIVTKDGFYMEKGYVFGGSAAKNQTTTSIIGRAKKLEQIAGEKIRLLEEMKVLKAEETGRENTVNGLRQEIVSAENCLKEEEIELANAQSKKESAESSLKKIKEEVSIVELEIDEVGELIREISTRGETLNVTLNENESEYAREQEVISSSQEAVQNKTKAKNDLILEISEIKSGITFLKDTEESEARNLDKELKLLEEVKEQYASKEEASRGSEEKIRALETEAKDLAEQIEAEKDGEASLKEKLNDIYENKKTLSRELHNKEGASRERENAVENLRNQIRNLEIKNRESELKISNIKDRMRDAYKVDIGAQDIQIEEGTNTEEIRNQIEVLRIKLEKLGPVNLVAIEEHKELEERYSFLTQQEEDLLRAKESLHRAITKINRTTKQLFMESFQKIQVEFKNYFRMLFGGGHAELLLLDETDVLESGIEIVARPPGKKLQNLLLLSGGEKALTAIALMFAIFKVKPSPFCILDEVDAPLDESNIGRFTRILQEFLKTSQFIVITHSKKTMQMANILYGITMQEKGVSKIVSVKFAESGNQAPPKEEEVLV
ncbi:MAG: chromosome segregation protein SMC [Candidatus Omnitrophica bacterium]|nr:chromosome segregation protein SMC [Candidatus Omnitrophota bacterium]